MSIYSVDFDPISSHEALRQIQAHLQQPMQSKQIQVLTLDDILEQSETYSDLSMPVSFDLKDILVENSTEVKVFDEYQDLFQQEDDSVSVTLTKKSETVRTVSKVQQLRNAQTLTRSDPDKMHFILRDTVINTDVFKKNVTFMCISNVSKPFEANNKSIGLPTAIAATGSKFLAIGTSQSSIALFQMGVKNYRLMETVNKNKYESVTSISISRDSLFMVCGYKNGYITIWDLSTFSLSKTIQSELNTETILKVQFVNNNEFISSDIQGNVMIHTIEKYVWTSVKSKKLVNRSLNNAYYDIKPMRLTNNRVSITLVSFNSVVMVALDPIEAIFQFEKPQSVPLCIPVVDVGNLKIGQSQQNCVLVSWSTRLYVYEYRPMNRNQVFHLVHVYDHGFLNLLSFQLMSSCSVILIDLSGTYRIVNVVSRLQKQADYIRSQGALKQELLSGRCQINEDIKQRNAANTVCKATDSFNEIFFVTERGIFRCRFHKWAEMIYYLIQNKEYKQALKCAIEIFNDRLDIFSERVVISPKTMVLFNDMITYYLNMRFKEIRNLSDDQVRQVISTSIQFCLEIHSQNHLFTKVFSLIHTNYHLQRVFLECLQPFIRIRAIKQIPSFALFQKIIDHYAEQDPALVDVLILFLDPHSIDYFATLDVCVQHKLYRSLVYVSELNGDFVSPANKIMQACVGIRDVGGSHQKIEQYLSLLYLQIIKLLEGRTLADTQLSQKASKLGLVSLSIWMTIEENVKELVSFNGLLYFEVLEKMLNNEMVIKAMDEESPGVTAQKIFSLLRGKVAGDKESQQCLARLMTNLGQKWPVDDQTVAYVLCHLGLETLPSDAYKFVDTYCQSIQKAMSQNPRLEESMSVSVRAVILLNLCKYSQSLELFAQLNQEDLPILFDRLSTQLIEQHVLRLVELDPDRTALYVYDNCPENIPQIMQKIPNNASTYLFARRLRRLSPLIYWSKEEQLHYLQFLCSFKSEPRVLYELRKSSMYVEDKRVIVQKHNLKECVAYLSAPQDAITIYKQLYLQRFGRQFEKLIHYKFSNARDFKRVIDSMFRLIRDLPLEHLLGLFSFVVQLLAVPSRKKAYSCLGEQIDQIAKKKEAVDNPFITTIKQTLETLLQELGSRVERYQISSLLTGSQLVWNLKFVLSCITNTLTKFTLKVKGFCIVSEILKSDDRDIFDRMLESKASRFYCKPVCRSCTLFLIEGLSSSRVFDCGHSFHSECLVDTEECQSCHNRLFQNRDRQTTLFFDKAKKKEVPQVQSNLLYSLISFQEMIDRQKEDDWSLPRLIDG